MLHTPHATSDKRSYSTDVEAYIIPEKDSSIGVKPQHLYGVKATANLVRYTVDLSLGDWRTWNLSNQSRNFRKIFKVWPDVLHTICATGRKYKRVICRCVRLE